MAYAYQSGDGRTYVTIVPYKCIFYASKKNVNSNPTGVPFTFTGNQTAGLKPSSVSVILNAGALRGACVRDIGRYLSDW